MNTKSNAPNRRREIAARVNLIASNAALQAAFAGNDAAAMNRAVQQLQVDVRRARALLRASDGRGRRKAKAGSPSGHPAA
jgi:hypothetical protein